MTTQLDGLMQQLSELTATIKDHKADPATIDMKALETALLDIVDRNMLIRRGESQDDGEFVGPEGFKVHNPIVRSGKFAGLRKADIEFTSYFMRKAHALNPATVRAPSEELTKALTSTGSGTGDELVPTGFAASLWQDFFLMSKVGNALGTPVAMPTDPFELPLGLGDVTWYKGAQNTATTATDTATAKSTMTTTEQVAEVNWSYTLDEDAVVAVLPALKDRLAISGPEQIDAFLLSADATDAGTGNINLDDADPAATKWYLSDGQDGIRHQWLVDFTTQTVNAGGDALADADILSAFKLMGKYYSNPSRCMMVTDVSTYIKGLMNLDAVQTLDKYGPNAVVVRGELAQYRGVPIIVSASHPLCEADGKVSTTAGNNTLGSISILNRDMWKHGFRRQILIEVDRNIQTRQFILVVSFRIAIAAHGTRASATHTAGIRNILV